MPETWVWSLGWEDPLEEEMATLSSRLAWKFHGQRGLEGCRPWCCKESDVPEWLTLSLSLIISECWPSFHVPVGWLCIFCEKVSVQVLCPGCCVAVEFYGFFNYYFEYNSDEYDLQISSPIQLSGLFNLLTVYPSLCRSFLVWYSPICLFLLLFPLPLESVIQKHH